MPERDAVAGVAAYGTVVTREKQGSGLNAIRLSLTTGPGGSGSVSVRVGCGGRFDRLVIVPSGTDVPTALWDLTITDEDGVVVYTDTALSESATTIAYPSGTDVQNVFGTLTFLVENAGVAKSMDIIAYFH